MNWISIKDKLPDDDLLFSQDIIIFDALRGVQAAGVMEEREGKLLFKGCMQKYDEVTHWMPLPKPPEE